MKIYDISQEILSCKVFPGDPAPVKEVLARMADGKACNLTAFSMCSHNGTHVDAPFHFVENGKTVDEIGLESFVGMAYVAEHEGVVTAEEAKKMLSDARACGNGCDKRILIKGKAVLSLDAAKAFAEEDIILYGNESQTVGPEDAPMAVHKVLLGKGIVLLEGIRLGNVRRGAYLLNAAPLNFAGFEGAPCRAVLLEL